MDEVRNIPCNYPIYVVKANNISTTPVSNQTKRMRESTNDQIRNFGKKYYQIKAIIEQLNINRDDLFKIGKDLEKEYKDIKIITKLQTQYKRMKDALICWFCENFFDEIIHAQNQFFSISKQNNQDQGTNLFYPEFQQNENQYDQYDEIPMSDPQFNEFAPQANESMNFMWEGTKFNNEIDDFYYSHDMNENNQQQNTINSNFDFGCLLNL